MSGNPLDQSPAKRLRIGIVAGEESGDILGAGLMLELRKLHPDCQFEGIGGSRMLALNFNSFFPQDRLAVMGFVEPLKRLPELLNIRSFLRKHFIANPPDVFIGIDSPDFNLNLETAFRAQGIPTVHYVGPSVWAWRQGRIKKIKRAVDLMLTLFPFENAIYEENAIPVVCVGHPLADAIPLQTDAHKARAELKLKVPVGAPVIALLPGSRQSEVARLTRIFFNAALLLKQSFPQLRVLCPAANDKRLAQILAIKAEYPGLHMELVLGQSHRVMAAADVVVMASGTTTLEAMLLKKPMVIAYKVAALSYWIYRQLVKVKMIGLPNLLAGYKLVPEFIQADATAEAIASAAREFLLTPANTQDIVAEFEKIHLMLKKNGNLSAALAVHNLLIQTQQRIA